MIPQHQRSAGVAAYPNVLCCNKGAGNTFTQIMFHNCCKMLVTLAVSPPVSATQSWDHFIKPADAESHKCLGSTAAATPDIITAPHESPALAGAPHSESPCIVKSEQLNTHLRHSLSDRDDHIHHRHCWTTTTWCGPVDAGELPVYPLLWTWGAGRRELGY